MESISAFQTPLIVLVTAVLAYRIIKCSRTSGTDHLPGPPPDSWLWGNLQSIREPEGIASEWTKTYGNTFAVSGFLGVRRLYTLDFRAIGHVLSHSSEFAKPWQSRVGITAITGMGILAAEGEVHKRQRKILNPVFSAAQIRELTPLFVQKAQQLRDIWKGQLLEESSGIINVDVLQYLGRAMLDVIGEAGFGYRFDSLVDESNELALAFRNLFAAVTSFNAIEFLQVWIPVLGRLPTRANKTFKRSTETLRRIGADLIEEKIRMVTSTPVEEKPDVRKEFQGKDLLSVLVKANTYSESDSQMLSQEEVLAQIATFITAGHETTSTALTYALYALAMDVGIQNKLRAEILACPHDAPDMEELNSLPYLDLVIRETLRLHAPVELTSRQPWKDEIVPLAEPVVDLNGNVCHEIHMKAGDVVFIPIREINLSKAIWGEDAYEFKPERWVSPPTAALGIPSVYSNLMSFLSGPRACIGWRMALMEMKAVIFVLLRTLQFEIDPSVVVLKKLG
ncbi:hypothetical protein FRB99_007515 [Tulasnella sp. 403]|nr:hypothetical protein FRB99_007515 [Tulasnella sp. 403]